MDDDLPLRATGHAPQICCVALEDRHRVRWAAVIHLCRLLQARAVVVGLLELSAIVSRWYVNVTRAKDGMILCFGYNCYHS